MTCLTVGEAFKTNITVHLLRHLVSLPMAAVHILNKTLVSLPADQTVI
jgi:hypothetical protein